MTVWGSNLAETEAAELPSRVVHHPGTGSGRAPDIALLRFASPVTHFAPVPIYRHSDELGRIIVMPGWGGTGTGKAGLGSEDGPAAIKLGE